MLGCSAADRSRKLSRTTHVESLWSPCLDAGSTPASSTKYIPAHLLGFIFHHNKTTIGQNDVAWVYMTGNVLN